MLVTDAEVNISFSLYVLIKNSGMTYPKMMILTHLFLQQF